MPIQRGFMIALAGIAIQDKIYESANSLVYRGITDDGLAIVIKMLKQDYPSPQELTRYRQEYQITRTLDLEGVIKAYSQRDCQRTLVMLLEDFGGESLEQWIRKCPETFCPMPLSTFLRLAIELTSILGEIHAAHVIHKDINPGNIVLNLETGVVKIIDFGIATQFSRTNPTFKNLHILEGTLAYLFFCNEYSRTRPLSYCEAACFASRSECSDPHTHFRDRAETDGKKCRGSLSECLGD
jgi:serine/threonine protein kinase